MSQKNNPLLAAIDAAIPHIKYKGAYEIINSLFLSNMLKAYNGTRIPLDPEELELIAKIIIEYDEMVSQGPLRKLHADAVLNEFGFQSANPLDIATDTDPRKVVPISNFRPRLVHAAPTNPEPDFLDKLPASTIEALKKDPLFGKLHECLEDLALIPSHRVLIQKMAISIAQKFIAEVERTYSCLPPRSFTP